MTNVKPKASIIILNFLKSKRVQANVDSIQKQIVNFPFEIIIIDNSCDENSAKELKILKKYKNISIYINEKNIGYIHGNNEGVKKSNGKYILIVNPDIIWKENDSLQKLVDYMDKNQSVGICGPKQINEDGGIAMTVRAFPRLFLQIARRTFLRKLPIIKKWVAYDEMCHLDYSKTQSVDWLQSSFWITRRSIWEKIGGLNTDYFIFMSDPDFCFKCWESKNKVIYYPEVTVSADGIRCSEGGILTYFKKWTLRQHLRDSIKYMFNHLFNKNPKKN